MTGFLIPAMYIFLGNVINENNQAIVDPKAVMVILGQFLLLLVVVSIFAFFERYCLSTYAGWFGIGWLDVENLARHLREKYIYALLHHDIDYIESNKPSTLGQAVAEESSRIINGLGPSIGQLIRSIAIFIGGVVVGLFHVLFLMPILIL